MATITDSDFQKLANAVAADLVDQRIPLNDTISKLASNMGMNDEQVCRLCEATNNVTFNKLFQAKGSDKTASDRLIEFDVADSKKILGGMISKVASEHARYSGRAASHEAAYMEMRSLDDGMHTLRHPEAILDDPGLSKVAFELRPEPGPTTAKDKRALVKAASELKSRVISTRQDYMDKLTKLSSHFSKLYDVMPFEQFERQAAALYKTASYDHLNAVRRMRRMPEVYYDLAMLEKSAGYVDDSPVEFGMLRDVINADAELAKLGAAVAKLERSL